MATTSLLFGYTGQYRDPVSAAYPLGNGYRSYLPGLMRFNAPDSVSPFGLGGVNPYAYCLDDPINRNDPSGHAPSETELESFVGEARRGILKGTKKVGDAPVGVRNAQAAAASSLRFHDVVHVREFNKETDNIVENEEMLLDDKSSVREFKDAGRNYFPPMSDEEIQSRNRALTPEETLTRAEIDVTALEGKISAYGKTPGYQGTDLSSDLAALAWSRQKRKIDKTLGSLKETFAGLRIAMEPVETHPLRGRLEELEDRTGRDRLSFDSMKPAEASSNFVLRPVKPRLLKS